MHLQSAVPCRSIKAAQRGWLSQQRDHAIAHIDQRLCLLLLELFVGAGLEAFPSCVCTAARHRNDLLAWQTWTVRDRK